MDQQGIFAFGILLFSALLMSFYSLFIKTSSNRLIFFACKTMIGMPVAIIAAFFVPFPTMETVKFLLVSSFLYNFMLWTLTQAYKVTDLSIAAPVMAAIRIVTLCMLSVAIFAERVPFYHVAAIAVIVGAIAWQINFKKIQDSHLHVGNLKFCLLTGFISGAQMFNDIMGVRSCENPFTWFVWQSFITLPLVFFCLSKHKFETFNLMLKEKGRIFFAEVFDCASYYAFLFVAYSLKVLYALPVYNMSIVFTTLLGVCVLKEKYAPKRIIAAALITASVVALKIK